jgi:hypothetical protein
MNKFIQEQINSYNGKKYNIITEAIKLKYLDTIFIVNIKNNKVNANIDNDMLGRKKNIILILNKMLEKYKLNDTLLLINLTDGYYWKTDIPVFSFSVAQGKKGLIFPNFDICYFDLLKKNFNQLKKIFNNYEPNIIKNDIYFKGGPSTLKKNLFREKMSKEKHPINVIAKKDYSESVYKFKDHKYLFDLPGVKPWSVRLKYLFLTQRIIFRISFYNSQIGESGYWRQFYDYIFNENKDYVHLAYNFNYDSLIPENLYEKIKKDIITKYYFFEKYPEKYNEMVLNLNKSVKKLTIDSMLKYLYTLISKYNVEICI